MSPEPAAADPVPAGRVGGKTADAVTTTLSRVVATDHARIIGAVIAAVSDWQAAEDAVQDAYARALASWPETGMPANPAGWIVTTARRRGVDLHRRAVSRDTTARRYRAEVERGLLQSDPEQDDSPEPDFGDEFGDDRLRLMCTCAHPALPLEGRVALTLRTVLGMPTEEIARLFLSTDAAVQKRLVRARAKIAHAAIPYRVPPPDELPDRIEGVLGVIYLLFTTGYAAGRGFAGGAAMDEAVRLARVLADLLATDERLETDSLLALMLLQRSRSAARFAPTGAPILLADQDRSSWDADARAEAQHLLEQVLTRAAHRRLAVGRYTLEAAIAWEHSRPASPDETDWTRIAQLHELLSAVAGGPTQRLAWAVAAGRAYGPESGLGILGEVADGERLHLYHATRADLLTRAGRSDEARRAYRRAAELAPTEAEADELRRRAASVRPR